MEIMMLIWTKKRVVVIQTQLARTDDEKVRERAQKKGYSITKNEDRLINSRQTGLIRL
jgi:hypothetical protein